MKSWVSNQDMITSNILPKYGNVNYYKRILTLKEQIDILIYCGKI